MKTKYGYRSGECRPTNGYRHLTVDIFEVCKFDTADSLLRAAESGDAKRIERFSKLAKIADGRSVYIKDSEASITWQADPSLTQWYAPSLSLNYMADRAAVKAVFKVFSQSNYALSPKLLVDSLGAIRLESLRDESDEIVYAGGNIAYVESNDADLILADPYPIAKEVA